MSARAGTAKSTSARLGSIGLGPDAQITAACSTGRASFVLLCRMDLAMREELLAQAERHVAEGERHIT